MANQSVPLFPLAQIPTATVLIKGGRAQGPFLGAALAKLLGAGETEWELTRQPNSVVFAMIPIVLEVPRHRKQ